MDSKAECGQEGVPSWASIGNQLFSGKELFGGKYCVENSRIASC